MKSTVGVLYVFVLSFFVTACSSVPKPRNNSGMMVKIEGVKRNSEGLEVRMAVHNTSAQTLRLRPSGSTALLLEGDARIQGQMSMLTLAPGQKAKVSVAFSFMILPGIAQTGVVELVPQKVFRSCSAADKDGEVVQEDKKARELAYADVEPDTCDRPLKEPIWVGF